MSHFVINKHRRHQSIASLAPKYTIDQQVWVVKAISDQEEILCQAGCESGNITLKDGIYTCPSCYGSGKNYISTPKVEVKKDPVYITGISFRCKKAGDRYGPDLDSSCSYYCMEELDHLHSVYEDSTGDLRFDEESLFPTYEEAIEAAKLLEIKLKSENEN